MTAKTIGNSTNSNMPKGYVMMNKWNVYSIKFFQRIPIITNIIIIVVIFFQTLFFPHYKLIMFMLEVERKVKSFCVQKVAFVFTHSQSQFKWYTRHKNKIYVNSFDSLSLSAVFFASETFWLRFIYLCLKITFTLVTHVQMDQIPGKNPF